jgi:ribonuclease Z
MQNMADVAAAKLHATTIEAATIAKMANVNKLIIGHFSNRYDNPMELVNEARTVFKNTFLADDGKVFDIELS